MKVKIGFDLTIYYENDALERVNRAMKEFGFEGKLQYGGKIGTHTVELDIGESPKSVISDKLLEKMRKIWQDVDNETASKFKGIELKVGPGYLMR